MRKVLIGAAMLMAVAACSSDGGTEPDAATHVGVYQLVSVNGQSLPHTLTEDGDSLTFSAGTVTLKSDNSFTDATTFTYRALGQPPVSGTQTVSGTYVRTGNNITFNMTSPEVFTYNMTLDGNTLTESGEGFTLVYRK